MDNIVCLKQVDLIIFKKTKTKKLKARGCVSLSFKQFFISINQKYIMLFSQATNAWEVMKL